MYSFTRDFRELSYSQSFPPTGFIPKTFKSKIDFYKYNQLPPIKEEEGNVGQSDGLRNISLYSQPSNDGSYKKGYKVDRTISNGKNERKNFSGEEWIKSEISHRSLPPLVNVNCLMNVNMKQQSILNTSFAKRLIHGKATIPETMSLPTIKKSKEDDEKLSENHSSKLANSNQSFLSNKHIQLGVGDKMAQTKKKKTKPVQIQYESGKIEERRKSKEQNPLETNKRNNTSKSETNSTDILVKTDLSSLGSLANYPIITWKPRNQNFLSHCVKNILGGITPQYTCKYCDEIFSQVEELDSHKEKHEREKETCILCNKVFYKPKEFTQHLLTHESVDKFSCKKCKKYFPNLQKYKIHCKNTHLMSLKSADIENVGNPERMKEQVLKYECKRCRLELDSEENLKVHRRNHIRLDIMGAYLLSNKNI